MVHGILGIRAPPKSRQTEGRGRGRPPWKSRSAGAAPMAGASAAAPFGSDGHPDPASAGAPRRPRARAIPHCHGRRPLRCDPSGVGRGASASASPRHSSLPRASAPAVRPIRLRPRAIGCPRCPPSASLRRFAFAMPPIRPRPALRAWGAARFGVGQAIAPRRHPFLPPGGQGPTPPVPPRLGDDPRPSGLPTSVAKRRQRRHLPPEVSTSGGCEAIATAGRRSGLAPPVK